MSSNKIKNHFYIPKNIKIIQSIFVFDLTNTFE